MDKETLSELAHSGSYEQLKACGFVKVKNQLKLKKVVGLSSLHCKEESGHGSGVNSRKDTKLSMLDMKLLSDDKRLYLLKCVIICI